jgi:hypothetical protein
MTPERKPWSRGKKVVVGTTAVFLLIMVPLSAYLFREMYEAKQVYNTFNEDWIAKDYPKAVSLITPGLDPDAARKSFFDFFTRIDSRAGALRSFKSGGINTQEDAIGSRTTIHAHLIFERGEADLFTRSKRHEIIGTLTRSIRSKARCSRRHCPSNKREIGRLERTRS